MSRVYRSPRFPWLAVVLLLGACATTPTASFFALDAGEVAPRGTALTRVLALGPIDLPEYLDRPQIVSRAGGNRLIVDEFNRWGGRLDQEIGRELTRWLGQRLGTRQVYAYPSRIAARIDYRVALEVRRFDGVLGGDVELDVTWAIIDESTAAVARTGHSAYRLTAASPGYDVYADVLGRLLARLGEDIATALQTLPAAVAAR